MLLNLINEDKLNTSHLCRNKNAISWLEQHPEKIDWEILSANPNALIILELDPEKILWSELSSTPQSHIFFGRKQSQLCKFI